MNISYNWLKDYLQFDLSPQETAEALTSIGLETGSIDEIQTIKGGLEGLVIGEVLTCCQHPNSDHLHLTTVNIGEEEPLKIVCGAPNVAQGQKVVIATVGTTLYSGDENFKIKKSKIRGEESFGMICAEDEIGIGTSHNGIIVLPPSARPGTLAKDYYNIKSDFVLEVDITPNRIDAASHYGVARDLAAYLKQNNIPAILTKPSIADFDIDSKAGGIDVIVEDKDGCARYSGLTIRGVEIKESPDWIKARLNAIGLRPINNVVDITNFILHESGHPMHAFDAKYIPDNKIYVRTVADKTKFIGLDEQQYELSDKDLMVCNSTEGMCIGGVFGGLNSGVSETTKDIFLECAYFNPSRVRKTARRHGLNTDSSFRFERGVNPNDTVDIIKRAAMLITEYAGGTIEGEIRDFYPQTIENYQIEISFQKINSLIGKEIPKETIKSILNSLEIEIKSESDRSLLLSVPPYRVDVTRDVDVIEEILRIYGYNNVEFSDSLKANLSYQTPTDVRNRMQTLLSEQLTAAGFNEIWANSLTKKSYYENNATLPLNNCITLLNPLSNDLGVMRQTLLYGGLESIQYNRNRRNSDLQFYEFGKCYFFDANKKREDKILAEYSEESHLALWICGKRSAKNWTKNETESSVFELKAYVENIISRLGISLSQIATEPSTSEIYSVGLTIIHANKILGNFGIVSKKILNQFDIDNDLFYAELNWDILLKAKEKHSTKFVEISKTQVVNRDLALLIDKSITFAQIEAVARKSEKKLLKKVTLFDVYEGVHLPADKKSYAVNFLLQDDCNTLNDKQIDSVMQKIQKNLEQELNAKLR